MSSILEALKRVEADRPKSASDGPGPTPPSHWLTQSETPPGWTDRLWAARTAAGCALPLVIMVLAAAAGLLSWHMDRHPPAAEKAPPLAPPPVLSFGAAEQPADANSAPPDKTGLSAPPAPPSAPARATPRPRPIIKAVEVAAEAPSTRQTGPKGGVLKPPALFRSKPNPRSESPPGKDEKTEGRPPKAAPFPLPAAAGLRLQAVSWSETPNRRIAVIDNRILHIGDVVDEFTMVDIEPDAAILSRQGVAYRLDFVPR